MTLNELRTAIKDALSRIGLSLSPATAADTGRTGPVALQPVTFTLEIQPVPAPGRGGIAQDRITIRLQRTGGPNVQPGELDEVLLSKSEEVEGALEAVSSVELQKAGNKLKTIGRARVVEISFRSFRIEGG